MRAGALVPPRSVGASHDKSHSPGPLISVEEESVLFSLNARLRNRLLVIVRFPGSSEENYLGVCDNQVNLGKESIMTMSRSVLCSLSISNLMVQQQCASRFGCGRT